MTCPVCRNPSVARYRPFCTKRCADLDLGRWMTGAYAVPAEEPEDLEEAAEELGALSAAAGRDH